MSYSNSKSKKQSGAVLIIGLLFLITLTLLGVSSMSTSILEEQIAGNISNRNAAFQAAESALKDGENWLNGQTTVPLAVDLCEAPPCDLWEQGTLPDLKAQTAGWWTTNAKGYSTDIGGYLVASDPVYVIEEQYFVPDDLSPETQAAGIGLHYYRVTSSGTGANTTASSIVQSIYVVRFN